MMRAAEWSGRPPTSEAVDYDTAEAAGVDGTLRFVTHTTALLPSIRTDHAEAHAIAAHVNTRDALDREAHEHVDNAAQLLLDLLLKRYGLDRQGHDGSSR